MYCILNFDDLYIVCVEMYAVDHSSMSCDCICIMVMYAVDHSSMSCDCICIMVMYAV